MQTVYGGRVPPGDFIRLQGEASSRIYYRFATHQGVPSSVIVMKLPSDALKSEEGGSGPRPKRLPFLELQHHLAERGVPVPEVLVDDAAVGFVVLEDLGDATFEKRLLDSSQSSWEGLYRRAIDVLVQMQRACAPDKADGCIAYQRKFDAELLRWELEHFKEYGLIAPYGPLSEEDTRIFDSAADELVKRIVCLPQGFVHRDFQSRNLMWHPDGKLRLIDFQDALLGPYVYDLVALLCDSYVALSAAQQTSLIGYYARQVRRDPDEVREAFFAVAAQRKLKDAGRFVFIDRVRGNPSFLPHYPQSLVYVDRALCALGLTELHGLLRRRVPGYPDAVEVPRAATGTGPM